MNQKILFEIRKFEEKKENRVKTLPASFLFTDRKKISDFETTVNSLPKECGIVVREYDLNKNDRELFAKNIITLAKKRSLKVLIGKDLSLAKKLKADGVHFSDSDLNSYKFLPRNKFNKDFIFTFSSHNLKSALRLVKIRPEIVFISPIFPTSSHLHTKALGLQKLAKIYLKSKTKFYSPTRFYALGGINKDNLTSIRKLGISGFAAIDLFKKTL